MRKTVTVNIAGLVFYIDDDAFAALNKYLNSVRSEFKSMEGGNEIYEDIESRIAELFNERLGNNRQVITLKEVEEVIEILGQPGDFFDDSETGSFHPPHARPTKRLYRDTDNRIVAGVCSGLAAYWSMDPTLVRLVFVILAIFGMAGVLIYLILWLVLPEARTVAQKLEMRGEPVNLSNIGAFFREEFENVKRSFSKK